MTYYPRTISLDEAYRLARYQRPGLKIVVGPLVAVEIAIAAQ